MGKTPIYLDYNATTPIAQEVISAVTNSMLNHWGNPSSTYTFGSAAKNAIEESRVKIADMIHGEPRDIIFTSGGTEANKLAIDSAIYTGNSSGELKIRHVITSNVEHCSVHKPLVDLKRREVIELSIAPVNQETGAVEVDTVLSLIRPDTRLISIMHANNETGVLMPIAEIGRKLKAINAERIKQNLPKIYFHSDTAQTIGKIEVDTRKLHVDYLTVVGHKFYGPKIGAFYARGLGKSTLVVPTFLGGGQESNYRSGTENACMIEGLGVAAELVTTNLQQYTEHMTGVKKTFKLSLQERVPDLQINFEDTETLPNTLSVAVPNGLTGASVLKKCGDKICASLGAACHSSSQETESSSTLISSGLSSDQARRTIRLSVGRDTSIEEVELAAQCIASACEY